MSMLGLDIAYLHLCTKFDHCSIKRSRDMVGALPTKIKVVYVT